MSSTLKMPFQPPITSLDMLCDRLSNLEETTSTILQHLGRQEMTKPFGKLNTRILGIRVPFPVFLEREEIGQKWFDIDTSNRPHLEASAVKLDFVVNPCTPCHFHPFFRDLYPQHAEKMVEIETNWEVGDGLARCKDFEIKSMYDEVFVEVTRRLMYSALNTSDFSNVTLLTGILSDGWILRSKHRNVTISQHISEILRLLKSVGIEEESIAQITIAPCTSGGADLFRLGRCFRSADETARADIKNAAKAITSGDVKYLERHPVVQFEEMYEDLVEALGLHYV